MTDGKIDDTDKPDTLGRYLKSVRLGKKLTRGDVEEATSKEVSNGYLSQLESGQITKPSPHVLYALSTSLGIPYETLMERAGYIVPSGGQAEGAKHGKAATYSVDNLSADEEAALLDYLNFIRSKRG